MSTEETPANPPAGSKRKQFGPFAQGNNRFAVALYQQLNTGSGNLLCAPLSVRTALCLALAGASSETAAQLESALHAEPADEPVHVTYARMHRRWADGNDAKYRLVLANALWYQSGLSLLPSYRGLLTKHYGNCLRPADFRREPEAAGQTINAWVAEQTQQRFHNLISPGGLDADTRIVLANALYFRGQWETPFEEIDTRDGPFWLAGGQQVQVPLMYGTCYAGYFDAGDFQAIELMYEGKDISLLLLVPHRYDGLPALEAKLSARLLEDVAIRLERRDLDLHLPRFQIRWNGDLTAQLAAMGIPLAFTPEADFSGINGSQPHARDALYLSKVLHQVWLDLDENGTEMAAATEIWMALGGPLRLEPLDVRVDRPFLFALRDRMSGTVFCLGRMHDPRERMD